MGSDKPKKKDPPPAPPKPAPPKQEKPIPRPPKPMFEGEKGPPSWIGKKKRLDD